MPECRTVIGGALCAGKVLAGDGVASVCTGAFDLLGCNLVSCALELNESRSSAEGGGGSGVTGTRQRFGEGVIFAAAD